MDRLILHALKYILRNYPHKGELSASRLTKMLYLADWKSALQFDRQFTDKVWHFNHYGPYIDDFVKMAYSDDDIEVTNTTNYYGGQKQLFTLRKSFDQPIELTPELKETLDFVISVTKDKNYEDFIKLVYSTYPVISSSKYSNLDLVQKAREYKEHLPSA
ncbi:TPA: Panacea domain-containing protein [Vibrio vulnificus]